MLCLSMMLLCYRITCLWFCNKKGHYLYQTLYFIVFDVIMDGIKKLFLVCSLLVCRNIRKVDFLISSLYPLILLNSLVIVPFLVYFLRFSTYGTILSVSKDRFLLKILFVYCLERGKWGRETLMWGGNINLLPLLCALSRMDPQLRHVPWLGIELTIFCFVWWCLTNWAVLVRVAKIVLFLLFQSEFLIFNFSSILPLFLFLLHRLEPEVQCSVEVVRADILAASHSKKKALRLSALSMLLFVDRCYRKGKEVTKIWEVFKS